MKLYNLLAPNKSKVPILASIPHSGIYIPPTINRQFKQNPRPILTNMDWHLDKLYDFLNREVKEPLFGPNVSSVISQDNTQGSPLYDTEPTKGEIETRIAKYYYPYHDKLRTVLEGMIKEFGQAVLFDLHSYFLYPLTDICLGNCNGTTCSERALTSIARAFF
jgi:N-formylglutamate deformylase